MIGPDRIVVGDAFGVMPHSVAVDDVGAGGLGDADHAAVDVGRDTAEQLLGNPAHASRPVLADEVVVAADAAAGHDHRRCAELEVADDVPRRRCAARRVGRLQYRTPHPDDRAVGDDEFIDPVPMREAHPGLVRQAGGRTRRRSPGRSPR